MCVEWERLGHGWKARRVGRLAAVAIDAPDGVRHETRQRKHATQFHVWRGLTCRVRTRKADAPAEPASADLAPKNVADRAGDKSIRFLGLE